MTYLFRSWRESLSLFKPKNAKLFILVTFKTIVESYKLFLKHFWWLLLLTVTLDSMNARYFAPQNLFFLLPLFGWFITIFAMYLILRPSLKRKNLDYYKDHIQYFIYFIVLTIIISLLYYALPLPIKFLVTNLLVPHQYALAYLYSLLVAPIMLFIPADLMPPHVSPLLTFMILFTLDSDGRIISFFKSIIRGIKMAFYNYPFCVIIFALFALLSFFMQLGIYWLLGSSNVFLSPLFSALLLPIPLALWTNFYTKRLHDQFGLYYPDTVKE